MRALASASAPAPCDSSVFEPALLGLNRLQRGLQIGERVLHVLVVGALQREQLRQFVDLRVEPGEHIVPAADLAAKQELGNHEDRQQKHDRQKQRRQGVDETWPIVYAAVAAPAGKGHQLGSLLFSALAIFSSVARIAFCSSDWASTQSRIICCSLRMFLTSPEIPSARFAMAVATR